MKKPDIFDPSKRYVFKNWSDEDFMYRYSNPDFQFIPPADEEDYTQKEIRRMYTAAFAKDGFKTITIPKGGMVEVPEWLAFLLCKHFVDREYIKAVQGKYGPISISKRDGKRNEEAEGEILSMNDPNAREALEEKTIQLIKQSEESPIITAMREQIRKEEREKLIQHSIRELEITNTTTPEHAKPTTDTIVNPSNVEESANPGEFADANE